MLLRESATRWKRLGTVGSAARARSALQAIAAAVITELLFDVAFSFVGGSALDLGYVGLCGLLMVAAGMSCAAAAALLPGTGLRLALTLYVVAHGWTDPSSAWTDRVNALAMGAAAWAFFAPNRLAPERVSGIGAGAIAAAAICVANLLWPYLEAALPVPQLFRWQWVLVHPLVFALVLLCAHVWEFLRGRVPALFSAAIVSWIGLALSIDGVALAVQRLRPQMDSVAHAPAPAATARPSLPDVFVIVLDTVRADHLTSYGYGRNTTPQLTRFLGAHPEAVQYDLALSTASWTIPAHASLLTGVMPSAHHARSRGDGNFGSSSTETLTVTADTTLAEALRTAGYCTTAVVANAYLLRVQGLQRGFEAFFQPQPSRPLRLLGQALRRRLAPALFAGVTKPYPLAHAVNRHVVRMHEECRPRASFVLANYMDAHSPFLAPPPHAGLFVGDWPIVALADAVLTDSDELIALKRDRYDESLHYLDANLGQLFADLERSGAMERAWLFITADHGESFREHETTSHGSSIYNEQVRIPLIVKPPRGVRLPRTVEPVSLLDVSTTIAAIAGRPGFGVGHDLREPLPAGRPVGIEFRGLFRASAEYGATADKPARAVVVGHLKLLERGASYEVYDLESDPHELADRGSSDPEVLRVLTAALPRAPGPGQDGDHAEPPLRADEIEDLRALGYVR